MSHRLPCEFIQDMLPLYIDGIAGRASDEAIREHIAGCSECREMLEQMQQAIAAIKASGQERALPQYDNDQALMTELDKLMAATLQYEVDCTEGTTQEGYLVLRPVTLTYQTASYAQSRQIIDALSASANVNFLSNVDVQYDADKAQYKTVLHLIFFELMP